MENIEGKLKSAAEPKEEHSAKESSPEPVDLKNIISPRTLELLTNESGYTFAANPYPIEPHKYGWFTDEETKTIYYNPKHLTDPEFKKNPRKLEWLLLHEAGHHTETEKMLGRELKEDFNTPEIIPEELKGDDILEQKFQQMLHTNVHNILRDVWDEAWMSRPPRADIKETFKQAYSGERESMKEYSKLDQLEQLIVGEHRYPPKNKTLADMYEKEVLDIYREIKPYLEEFESVKPFSRLVAPRDTARNMAKKAALYRKHIRPAFLKLLNQDIEKIKQEARKE